MAGRGTDIILGGVSDHRAKAILVEQQIDPEQAVPEARQAATDQVLREMGGEFRKALGERKDTAEDKKTLAQRFLGLMASFASDHPSVVAVRDFAPDGSPLRRYLDTVRDLPRRDKEKIAKAFYPEIENPVDFLAVHPLKTSPDEVAATREFAKVQELLEANERERVVALGGLHILATERHEARRIDNQLRGRAGRQGDPGSSRFYLSLQDDLMRIFGSERISGLMLKLGMEEGVPIEHRLVTRSIERAQKQVEAQNFGIRKHLLEYDDVMNKQRTAVYDMRRSILEGKRTRDHVLELAGDIVEWYLDNYCSEKDGPEDWSLESLQSALKETFGLEPSLSELRQMGRGEMQESLLARVRRKFEDKEQLLGPERMLFHARMIMLQIVDTQWKDHLYSLDHLKEGIGLRGYGQRDPLVEYKKESFQMFQALMDRIDEEVLRWIFLYQPVESPPPAETEPDEGPLVPNPRRPRPGSPVQAGVKEPELAMAGVRAMPKNLSYNDPSTTPSGLARAAQPREAEGGTGAEVQTFRREGKKVGRNDPCPCGS